MEIHVSRLTKCDSGTGIRRIDAQRVDKFVQDAMKFWRIPGVGVAVISGNDVYMQGYGVREVGKPEVVTPDTLFAICSVSKSFTTTAMAMLVDEGKMAWDDPVRKYVPDFRLSDPVADASVTLRDIVSNRSGLPGHWPISFLPLSRKEMLHRYSVAPMKNVFRSAYQYTNIGFYVAGLAVGEAAGCTFEEFLQKRVLNALGMKKTRYTLVDAKASPNHANPHILSGNKVAPSDWLDLDRIVAAGGVVSSVSDMANYVKLHLGDGTIDGKRLVSAAQLEETHSPQMAIPKDWPQYGCVTVTNVSNYCLGWIKSDYRGQTIVTHGGYVDGFQSRLTMIPSAGVGVIVLTNLTPGSTPMAIANGILDDLIRLPAMNWNTELKCIDKASEDAEKARAKQKEATRKRGTRPSKKLEEYAGRYEHPAYGVLTIKLDHGALAAEFGKQTYRLRHFHYDQFTGKYESQAGTLVADVMFSLNAHGEVASARILEYEDVEFVRVVGVVK